MWAPHFNVGYTFSSGSSCTQRDRRVQLCRGTEIAVSPKVTVIGDLLGRSPRRRTAGIAPTTFNFRDNAGTAGSFTVDEYQVSPGSLNLLVGAFGVKFNPTANLLISANVLVPLTKAGIRDKFTPIVGFDYAF
jgi:hypothetical protein